MCLGFYGIKLYMDNRRYKQLLNNGVTDLAILSPGIHIAKTLNLKTKINPLLLAIPALCDICGSTLMNIALTQCAASIYQMIRGIIVLITAGMAMIFLKKKQYIHHFSALAVIFIGVFLVGLSSLIHPEEGTGSSTSALGIILLVVS